MSATLHSIESIKVAYTKGVEVRNINRPRCSQATCVCNLVACWVRWTFLKAHQSIFIQLGQFIIYSSVCPDSLGGLQGRKKKSLTHGLNSGLDHKKWFFKRTLVFFTSRDSQGGIFRFVLVNKWRINQIWLTKLHWKWQIISEIQTLQHNFSKKSLSVTELSVSECWC